MKHDLEQVQRAVNTLGAVLKENAALRRSLESAQTTIAVLKDSIPLQAYRIAYSNATPRKFVEIADEAINNITEALK